MKQYFISDNGVHHVSLKLTYLLIVLALMVTVFSCKKFTEVGPPKNELVRESVFSTNSTANTAMLNIYSYMVSYRIPFNFSMYTALSADELTSYSNSADINRMYVNKINPLESSTNTIWNAAYTAIFKANDVIEGCNASNTLDAQVKKQLIGEGLFIRALWHFYLVNCYGKVPLVLTTDYKINAALPRMETEIVYQQIIDDLKNAQINLADHYVGANGVDESSERVRPDRATATALLARVYLFTEHYSDAEAQATAVIGRTEDYELQAFDTVFLKNNKEAIFQFMTVMPTTFNTSEGRGFILTSIPTGIENSSTISTSLINSFEPDDSRQTKWIGKYTDMTVTPNVDYLYPFKYKIKTGATVTEYTMVLRLAEQYLIRAEARAKLNNLSGAIADLDVIRRRAGLPLISNVNPGITQNDLLDAILRERRVELFTEWGHRWLDLKRTGKINDVMTNAAIDKGSTWDSNKQLWPIPPAEIRNNSKLEQNPSYN